MDVGRNKRAKKIRTSGNRNYVQDLTVVTREEITALISFPFAARFWV